MPYRKVQKMVNETILVADGNGSDMSGMAQSLRNCGHKVIIATDDEETMTRAKAEKPGLVIVDAALPQKNGNCICRSLKECPQTSEIKVLLLHDGEATNRSQWPADADRMLRRPITGDQLMETVARMI
jgi:DNA-binding response OmpR family regulator